MVDKIREARLKWFGHVIRRYTDASMRSYAMLVIMGIRRGRGRPKKSLRTCDKTKHGTIVACRGHEPL